MASVTQLPLQPVSWCALAALALAACDSTNPAGTRDLEAARVRANACLASAVSVSPDTATVAVGDSAQFSVTITNGQGCTGNWAANPRRIATVAPTSGMATWAKGVADGVARVTVGANMKKDTAFITVDSTLGSGGGGGGTVDSVPVVPGAYGFGIYTKAGRGGRVIRVTNLADAGPGSLRAALQDSTGPRTVVFEVSGRIPLTSGRVVISSPFITVAGQTAPSPGINYERSRLSIQTHDVLIQHLRGRAGDALPGDAPGNRDCLDIEPDPSLDRKAYNVVIDHVSCAWGIDENLNTYFADSLPGTFVRDITLWRTIVAEGLYDSIHDEGAPHSMGMLIGQNTERISIIQTLWSDNQGRNPKLNSGVEAYLANNVFYNWGRDTAGGAKWATMIEKSHVSSDATLANIIGNVYLPGLNTPPTNWAGNVSSTLNTGSRIWVENTLHPTRCPGGTCADRWAAWNVSTTNPFKATAPIPELLVSGYTPMPASAVESYVLPRVGARPLDRDQADQRIVSEVQSRTGRQIDSQTQVGGYPALTQNTRALTVPANPHVDSDGDGYTNLEEWLHGYAQAVEGP